MIKRAQQLRQRLIAPEVLAGLANLELVARTVVDGAMTGLHRSPRFGFSQEFAEYRSYTPGDDLRFIDWNVFARTDRLFVKRFFGDTNTRLLVLLDASASMGTVLEGDAGGLFRRPQLTASPGRTARVSKLDYARYVAAALFYLAARQHDAAGLLVFDADVRELHQPTARALGIRRLYHVLDQVSADGVTNWELALSHVGAQISGKSLIVLISDCYVEPELFGHALKRLGVKGHDLLVVHLLTPEERRLPVRGNATLRDAETGQVMDVAAEDLHSGYPGRLAAHVDALRRMTLAANGHFLQVDTDQPLDATLVRYLKFRARHP